MPIIALAVMKAIVIPLTYGSDFEMLAGVKEIMEKSVRKIDFFKRKEYCVLSGLSLKGSKRKIAYKYRRFSVVPLIVLLFSSLKGLLFQFCP